MWQTFGGYIPLTVFAVVWSWGWTGGAGVRGEKGREAGERGREVGREGEGRGEGRGKQGERGREARREGEGSGERGGGKLGERGREVGRGGREAGIGYPLSTPTVLVRSNARFGCICF